MHYADDERDRQWARSGDLVALVAVQYERMREFVGLHRLDAEGRQEVLQNAITRHLRELQAGKDYGATPYRAVAYQLVQYAAGDYRQRTHAQHQHEGAWPEGFDVAVRDEYPGCDLLNVAHLLAGLTEREGEVARMLWLDGMSHEQVAQALGITRNAVDQAAFRARTRMKAMRS